MAKKTQTATKKSKITSNKVARKLGKELGKEVPALTLVEITPEKVKTRLSQILSDHGLSKLIHERAAIGCSLGSIAATLKIPYSIFQSWVLDGKSDYSKFDPEFAKTDEMVLWELLSEGWAKARTVCEGMVMQQDPEKFLKSKASRLLGDDHVEEQVLTSDENSSSMQLDMGIELIETLRALRAQKVDLNEVIDQDKLSLRVSPPVRKKDIFEENNLTPTKNCSLPAIFQASVETLPVPLDKAEK